MCRLNSLMTFPAPFEFADDISGHKVIQEVQVRIFFFRAYCMKNFSTNQQAVGITVFVLVHVGIDYVAEHSVVPTETCQYV